MKKIKRITAAIVIIVFFSSLSSCEGLYQITTGVQYNNPSWAPPYYNGSRYYYFPDMEMYYDLADQDFVYLNNGQWLFSSTLPSVYANIDLFNSFVITLNLSVYQPWMHHQYYVSHYPRYYYHNVYQNINFKNLRGFNENDRKPIYWQQGERERIIELRKNERPEKKQEIQRPPQNTNYYGKPIGQPVKVKPRMRNNEKQPGRN